MELGSLATCSIVASELYFGVEKSKFKTQNVIKLKNVLDFLVLFDFGLKEARCYAQIRATLESQRNLIGNMDMLIAATALANNLILVTNDEKDFKRIKNLKIENWTK